MLLNNRYDIGSMTFIGSGKTIIMVAAAPNTVIGRNGAAQITLGTNNSLYLGTWPFTGVELVNIALALSIPVTTYPFIVNSGGSAYDYLKEATVTTPMFIRSGNGNVVIGSEYSVHGQYLSSP
jgi:hypothetical protein